MNKKKYYYFFLILLFGCNKFKNSKNIIIGQQIIPSNEHFNYQARYLTDTISTNNYWNSGCVGFSKLEIKLLNKYTIESIEYIIGIYPISKTKVIIEVVDENNIVKTINDNFLLYKDSAFKYTINKNNVNKIYLSFYNDSAHIMLYDLKIIGK